ncbi:hypothetical protein C8J57DRAFT_1496076 [Mycena rebaudengoi]|nr:hypothetical protein C8J57DRAFT_1496076 [Mycena rebaudengoi]
MPRMDNHTKKARHVNLAQHPDINSSGNENNENTSPNHPAVTTGNLKTFRAQICEKDARIAELEAIISGLETEVFRLQSNLNNLHNDHERLTGQYDSVCLDYSSLRSLKRKADKTSKDELRQRIKRIRRLEHDREVKAECNAEMVSELETTLDDREKNILTLEKNLASVTALIHTHNSTISTLKSTITD